MPQPGMKIMLLTFIGLTPGRNSSYACVVGFQLLRFSFFDFFNGGKFLDLNFSNFQIWANFGTQILQIYRKGPILYLIEFFI